MSTFSLRATSACVTIASYAVMNASGIAAASVHDSRSGTRAIGLRVGDEILGVATAADDAEHAIADRHSVTSPPSSRDLAGELEAGNVCRRAGRRGIVPVALMEVGAIERRRMHAHEHFVRRRLSALGARGSPALRDHRRQQ